MQSVPLSNLSSTTGPRQLTTDVVDGVKTEAVHLTDAGSSIDNKVMRTYFCGMLNAHRHVIMKV